MLELLERDELNRLVLDSGCGTGVSTSRLGRMHPECVVIGVDRSAARLRRGCGRDWPKRRGNRLWIRGELSTFWRLAAASGWRLRRHYLLYPNPWPKPAHLMRRWHAHPAFPVMLALGGCLELRSNWRVYAAEFARAAEIATGRSADVETPSVDAPLSPFEAKYHASGHELYRVRIEPGPQEGCNRAAK
jgi:tRNA G46 methylase TrmB